MRRFLPLIAVLALAGCGSSTKPADIPSGDTGTSSVPADTTAQTQTTAPTPTGLVNPKPCPGVPKASTTTDLAKKPVIPKQTGKAPSQLVIQDIVKGRGAAAKSGGLLTVRYVGVLYKNGKQFDASWDRNPNSFQFPLGQGQVIPGWDQGIVGMRAGGRRQLTIPSALAYGAQGSPPAIGPNEPLIFVVDLKKVSGS